jgi:hypothetical protein
LGFDHESDCLPLTYSTSRMMVRLTQSSDGRY